MTAPRQRWIVIGLVRREYVRIGNCGFPFGWRIEWRGRVDWCQPTEFMNARHLANAVRVRLYLSGLELLETQEAGNDRAWELRCLVSRMERKELTALAGG